MINKKEIINKIDSLLSEIQNGQYTLPTEIEKLEGMSGTLYRRFINKLVNQLTDINYLEIGCWKGSTVISAMYNNTDKIKNHYIIDNWSEFGGPQEEFKNNFKKFVGIEPNLFNMDCFLESPSKYEIKNIDLYLYDGLHTLETQEKALLHYIDSMNKTFIFIVDDYNWPEVGIGTENSIKKLNLKVEYKKIILTDDSGNYCDDCKHTWHNGVGIFILSK